MKNIFTLLFLIVGLFCAVNGQSHLLVSKDTIIYMAALSPSQAPETFDGVTNKSGQQDTIYWRPLVTNYNPGWQLSFCDPSVCSTYDTNIVNITTRYFAAKPDSAYLLKFGSVPNCIADTGVLQMHMWLQHDSAASSTVLTYVAIYTGVCPAAIANQPSAANIRIYPTPVSAELTVSGLANLNNSRIYVYDMLGNVLLKQDAYNGQNTTVLNTSDLHPGIYIVGVEAAGTRVLTKRIEKLD